MCGSLLPSGRPVDVIDGVDCTLIDNGMPCVILRASDVGATGEETREELEANETLKARVDAIRLTAGPLMNLGDVAEKSVPKMTLVSAAKGDGGRFPPAVSFPTAATPPSAFLRLSAFATACTLEGTPAAELATLPGGNTFSIEHPSGSTDVLIERSRDGAVKRAGMVRTTRKLFDGLVFPVEP